MLPKSKSPKPINAPNVNTTGSNASLDKNTKILCKTESFSSFQFDGHLVWFFTPKCNPHLERELFKRLAKQWSILFHVWTIFNEKKSQFKMMQIKAIEQKGDLYGFIEQAAELTKPFLGLFNFKIREIICYTSYGSYIIEQTLECGMCLDKNPIKANSCCGKYLCQTCDARQKSIKCQFCGKESLLVRQISPQQISNFYQVITESQVAEIKKGLSTDMLQIFNSPDSLNVHNLTKILSSAFLDQDTKILNKKKSHSPLQSSLVWYFVPKNNNIKLERELFKRLAKQWSIVFDVQSMFDKDRQLRKIHVLGVEQKGDLQGFIKQAIKLTTPMLQQQDLKIKEITCYTSYGSYEKEQPLQCGMCHTINPIRSNACCGKCFCQTCYTKQKSINCQYCGQERIIIRQISHQDVSNFYQCVTNFCVGLIKKQLSKGGEQF